MISFFIGHITRSSSNVITLCFNNYYLSAVMDTILHSSVCSIDSNKLLESSGVVLSCISIKYAAAATATSEHFGRTLLHFFHQLLTLLVIYTRRCTFTVHQLHSSGGRWPRPRVT